MKNILKTKNPNFIENFTIAGDKIIINLPKNRIVVVPYSKDKEKELLETMKKQAEKIVSLKKKFTDYIKLFPLLAVLFSFIMVGASALIPVSLSGAPIGFVLPIVTGLSLITVYYIIKQAEYKILNEIEKVELILDSTDEFNKNIDNEEMKKDISHSAYLEIKQVKNSGKELDINFLDKLSVNDLILMKEYLLENEETAYKGKSHSFTLKK